MKKTFYTTLASMLISLSVFAQGAEDALRVSQNFYEGTARFSAMGGAFGALGGDFSGLSVNPAGIGVYRSSEISLTPSFSNSRAKSAFDNQPARSDKKNYGDFNFGYVQNMLVDDSGFTLNLAVGYNTMRNFKQNIYSFNKTNSSFLDAIGNKMNDYYDYFTPDNMSSDRRYSNYYPEDWDAVLAWNTDLMSDDGNRFYSPLGSSDVIQQERFVENRGKIGEAVFSLGGNFNNTLFFGLTFGVQDIEYKQYVTYYEDVASTSSIDPTDLEYLKYRTYNETEGTGYNIKLGLMYRLGDLRIGAAVHTPTWMKLTNYYQAAMNSHFSSDSHYYDDEITPMQEFDYKVTTPAKYIGSLAYTFGTFGLISFDYEYVDYSTMKLKERYSADRGVFDNENRYIKNAYKGASNFRLGGEYKIDESFALRAGYAYYGNPYDKSIYDEAETTIWSLGLGYRVKGFYADLAYKYSTSKLGYYTYVYHDEGLDSSAVYSDYVSDKYNRNQFVLTLGFKF